VLRSAIVVQRALKGGGNTEYIRNMMLMDLMWSSLHSAVPAACYVEECLESSLATLSRRLGTDTRADTVADVSDTYIHMSAVALGMCYRVYFSVRGDARLASLASSLP
jgi:hypothetical protein